MASVNFSPRASAPRLGINALVLVHAALLSGCSILDASRQLGGG